MGGHGEAAAAGCVQRWQGCPVAPDLSQPQGLSSVCRAAAMKDRQNPPAKHFPLTLFFLLFFCYCEAPATLTWGSSLRLSRCVLVPAAPVLGVP